MTDDNQNHVNKSTVINRRTLMAGTAAVVATSALTNPVVAQKPKTVRAVMHTALRLIDPIASTAYISRDHGYMIYDTLVAVDENFVPRPQMADWTVSEDKKVYTFKLREGLLWHDGQPVTAEDCVASLKRWWERDTMGQLLATYVETLSAADPKTIVLKLKQPVGFVLDALGKPSSNVPFMMPKRVAETPSTQALTDTTGSGPFKFSSSEFQPGVRTVYLKNERYVPRKEAPSWASGGKVVNVDRVEWVVMPDAQTAINALANGEIDYIDEPQVDLLKLFEGNDDVVVKNNNKFGLQVLCRMNFLAPPFNDVRLRRAAMLAFKQENFLAAMVGDPDGYKVCGAMFICDTPLANDIGTETLVKGNGVEQAKKLLKEAGYDGRPVRIIQPTDVNTQKTQPIVGAQFLKQVGFNVELMPMDWQTAVSTRSNVKLATDGGWSLFFTGLGGADIANPLTSAVLNASGLQGYPGWAEDAEFMAIRRRFAEASSAEERKSVAAELQKAALEKVLYIPLGQVKTPAAWSSKLKGVLDGPAVPYFWNMNK